MGILFLDIIGLILILLVLVVLTHYYRFAQLGSAAWDNPDQQALQMTNRGARTWHAQTRTLRAIFFFLIAVLLTHITGASIVVVGWVGIIYVVATALMVWFFIIAQPVLHWMFVTVNMGIFCYILYHAY